MEAVTSSIRALIGLLLVAVGVYLFSLTKKQKNASANERPKSKSKKRKKVVKKDADAATATVAEESSGKGDKGGKGAVDASLGHSFVDVFAPEQAEQKLQPKAKKPKRQQQQELLGAAVEARWQSGREWFPGRIVKKHDDGSFTIDYDDGEKELHVQPSLVRLKGAATTLAGEPTSTADTAAEKEGPSEAKQEKGLEQSFMGSVYEDVDEKGQEYQFEVRDQADDDWQVVTAHKPGRTPTERKQQQAAVAQNSKNRKKREKKREHELLVRELQRQSHA